MMRPRIKKSLEQESEHESLPIQDLNDKKETLGMIRQTKQYIGQKDEFVTSLQQVENNQYYEAFGKRLDAHDTNRLTVLYNSIDPSIQKSLRQETADGTTVKNSSKNSDTLGLIRYNKQYSALEVELATDSRKM